VNGIHSPKPLGFGISATGNSRFPTPSPGSHPTFSKAITKIKPGITLVLSCLAPLS